MRYLGLLQAVILGGLVTSSAAGPMNISTVGVSSVRVGGVPSFHMNAGVPHSVTPGVTGLPTGPSALSTPVNLTPANSAMIRNDAWAEYNAELRQIPTARNPNRLAARQNLVDEQRFVQRPQSSHRYNFQFSDNEVRSVQAALRRLGIYSGQTDGILGPDTRHAIEQYQLENRRPVTGQPDPWLNASLGIF
jgi:Putative peptidoglycan binding domain